MLEDLEDLDIQIEPSLDMRIEASQPPLGPKQSRKKSKANSKRIQKPPSEVADTQPSNGDVGRKQGSLKGRTKKKGSQERRATKEDTKPAAPGKAKAAGRNEQAKKRDRKREVQKQDLVSKIDTAIVPQASR